MDILIGLFMWYAFFHTIVLIVKEKPYKKRTTWEKVVTWIAGFTVLSLIVLLLSL